MEVRYLTAADVVALHAATLEAMEQRVSPLRDPGRLESAVLRARTVAYYEGADLVRQAAVLAVGIAQNQPFVDGIKRAAFMAALVFLRVNGHPFRGDRLTLAHRIEDVAIGSENLEAATLRLEACLRQQAG